MFAILLPAILVAVLRGNIGTDSYNYLSYFENIDSFELQYVFEPGFEIISLIIKQLGYSSRANVAIIGFLIIFFLIKTFSRSNYSALIFLWLVFPMFFVDMTMNALRYGLAFSIMGYGISKYYEKSYYFSIILILIAFSIQFTSVLIFIPFLLSNINNKKYLILIILFFAGFLSIPNVLNFLLEHAIGKQDAYQYLQSPSKSTGLYPLAISIILYISFVIIFKKSKYSSTIHILIILECLSFYITQFSYAGVRLQTLFLYAILLYLIFNLPETENRIKYLKVIYLLGLISFMFMIKNISNTVWSDETQSPYLPYKFYWEEYDFNSYTQTK